MMKLRKKSAIKIVKPDGEAQQKAKESRPKNSDLAIKRTVESWIRDNKRNNRLAAKSLQFMTPPHSSGAS